MADFEHRTPRDVFDILEATGQAGKQAADMPSEAYLRENRIVIGDQAIVLDFRNGTSSMRRETQSRRLGDTKESSRGTSMR